MTETKISSAGVTFPDATVQASAVETVRKTSDETVRNSATLQNDDHLLFAMAANEVWEVTILLWVTAANSTMDFKAGFAVPSGCTLDGEAIGIDAADAFFWERITEGSTPDFGTQALTHYLGTIRAIVINSSTAGNFQFKWAQNTQNDNDLILKENSCIIAHKLN